MSERPYEVTLEQSTVDWFKDHPEARVLELIEADDVEPLVRTFLQNMIDLYDEPEYSDLRKAIALVLAEITPPP